MSDRFWFGFWFIVIAGIVSIVGISTNYFAMQNKNIAEAKTCEAAVILTNINVTERLLVCRVGKQTDNATNSTK